MNEIEYIINCSECNETTTVYAETIPEYCPMCGRRVEAESKMNEMNFYFYCSTTFGDINSGADITIPAGTLISPGESLTPSDVSGNNQGIVYRTTATYVLPASSSIYYCGLNATTAGSLQNVAENVLINHQFTGYTDFVNGAPLRCTNNYSILNGQNIENDDNLRFRISSHYAALAGATQDLSLIHI